MRVHANDGIPTAAKERLTEEGFKVTTDHVPQEELAAYLNKEGVEVLLVRSAMRSDVFYLGVALLFIYLFWGRVAQLV